MRDLPAPPSDYSDPAAIVGWIAIALVVCAVVAVAVLVQTLRSERREERERADRTLDAFRAECKAERDAHASSITSLRADHAEDRERIHARLDEHGKTLVAIQSRL